MYLPTFRSQREVFCETILRKELRDVPEWASRNLESTENGWVLRDADGLGLRVAFHSLRAKQLLVQVRQDVFPGFNEPKPWLEEDGSWSAWFGYAEPFDFSPSYVLG